MHNLVSGLPGRHRRALGMARLQAGILLLLIILATWPLTRTAAHVDRSAPVPSNVVHANRLLPQPWHQHLHLWQKLAKVQHTQLYITQLEFSQQQWIFYLHATDLDRLAPWLNEMRETTGLRLQLRSTEPQQSGFRIVVEGSRV
ncbi:hypothetical protein ACR0ST_09140 [Aliidiomarina sp. Khilg15.8]